MNQMDPRDTDTYERLIRRNDPEFRRWTAENEEVVAALPDRVDTETDAARYADLYMRFTVPDSERGEYIEPPQVPGLPRLRGHTLEDICEGLMSSHLGDLGGEPRQPLDWGAKRLAWGLWLVADPPSAEALQNGWCTARQSFVRLSERLSSLSTFGPPPTAAELDAGWRYEEPQETTTAARELYVVYREGARVAPLAQRDRDICRRDSIGVEWLPVGIAEVPFGLVLDPDDARREAEAYWRGDHECQASIEVYVRAYRRGEVPSMDEMYPEDDSFEEGDDPFGEYMDWEILKRFRQRVRSGQMDERGARMALEALEALGRSEEEIEGMRTLMREHGLDV